MKCAPEPSATKASVAKLRFHLPEFNGQTLNDAVGDSISTVASLWCCLFLLVVGCCGGGGLLLLLWK